LQAVIYAATCEWDADKRTKKDGSPLLPHEDLRYYARGVFAWPQVRWGWIVLAYYFAHGCVLVYAEVSNAAVHEGEQLLQRLSLSLANRCQPAGAR
jgi:hypothetical protein